MALVLANRVQETGTANTTVSFTLTGAVGSFQSFSAIGNTNTTYYSATDGAGNWEVGLGTYSTTGPTLTRTTVYASSNSGSAVTFSGVVNVFVTYPSGRSVNLDASGNVSTLGTVASGTWQGSTVGVAYGGTGVTTSSGANSVVLRDANSNITVNRISQGLQTVTASGGVTTLTAASQFNQALTGTGGHAFKLPDATTLTDTTTFQFNNNATGTLTIQNNAGTTVGTVAPGGAAGIALLSNVSVGGTWDVHAYIPEDVTWGTNALALGSTVITGGTWNGGTITSGYGGTGLTTFTGANNALYSTSASALVAGTLPAAAGGTGLTTFAGANNALYSTSASALVAGTLPAAAGGTGLTTFTGANNALYSTSASALAAGTLPAAAGGTGQSTYAVGDLLYASSSTALSRLADVATGSALLSGGIGAAPAWGQINLTTSVTGTLPVSKGGTGLSTLTAANRALYSTSASALVTGTLPVAAGGTGQTSYTANGIVYAPTSTSLSTSSLLTFDGLNLGVGLNLPVARLDVSSTATYTISRATAALAVGDYVTSDLGLIFVQTAGLPYTFVMQSCISDNTVQTPLAINPDGGSVGIGNINPVAKLDVVSSSSGATTEVLRLSNNGAGGGTQAQLSFYAASTNYAQITGGYSTTPNLTLNVASGGYHSWEIDNSQAMRLDLNGNLGVGAVSTPNDWHVDVTAIQLDQGMSLWTLSNTNAFLSQNLYYDSAGVYRWITANPATIFFQESGTFKFQVTNETPTAGGAISVFDDLLTITSAGEVSVTDTGAIKNSRINPRTSLLSTPATLTPNIQSVDQYSITALANALTINAPTGTPVDGNKLMFRFLDNGTSRALTWNATYTAIGVTLPVSTTASKTTYVGCIYNTSAARWDVVAVTTQA